MNIVDCLAIAPYYITLFFMPPPNIDLGKLAQHITKLIMKTMSQRCSILGYSTPN